MGTVTFDSKVFVSLYPGVFRSGSGGTDGGV